MNEVAKHYDILIDEGQDPVFDPKPLQDYMNKWDGQLFIDKMQLSKTQSVLEIGVGTGRIAVKVAPHCRKFTGIDISEKTVIKAKENIKNAVLICNDFTVYDFNETFDVIYSSLTFLHIKEKQKAFDKIAGLLNKDGSFVLSIDKNQDEILDTGYSKIAVYPDKPDDIKKYAKNSALTFIEQTETEFAYIFVFIKSRGEKMANSDTLKILFIRHAQTQYDNIGDRDPSDGELTPTGEEQCCELGKKLRDVPIDAYITSSLLRSFKTAAGVCKAKKDEPLLEICPELVECGCTPGYYGCSEEYLNRYYKNTKMCEKLFGTKEYEFGCEAFEDNVLRAEKVIEYITRRFTFGETVAVFSHHGMLEYLIPTALGVKPHIFRFSLENISVTEVEFCRDGNRILRCVNR